MKIKFYISLAFVLICGADVLAINQPNVRANVNKNQNIPIARAVAVRRSLPPPRTPRWSWGRPYILPKSKITAFGHGRRTIKKITKKRKNGKKKEIIIVLGGEDEDSIHNRSCSGMTLCEPTITSAGVAAAATKNPKGIPEGSSLTPMIERAQYSYVEGDTGRAVKEQIALRTIGYKTIFKKFMEKRKVVWRSIRKAILRPFRNDDTTVDLSRNSGQVWADSLVDVLVVPYHGPPLIKLSSYEREELKVDAARVGRKALAMNGFGNKTVARR